MRTKLFSNSVFYSLMAVLPSLAGVVTLPILTRYLTPEDFGLLSLVTMFVALISVVMSFQLQGGVVRLYFDYGAAEQPRYFSTLFWGLGLVSVLVFILILCAGHGLIAMLFSEKSAERSELFILASLGLVFVMPTSVMSAIFKVQQRGKDLLKISAVSTLVNVGATLFCVVILKLGIVGSLIGTIVAALVSYLLHVWRLRGMLMWVIDMAVLKNSANFCLPLIPHALGGYLFMYSDVFILEKYVTMAALGVYALSDQLSRVCKAVVNSFARAFSPIYMEAASEGKALEVVKAASRSWFVLLGCGYVCAINAGALVVDLVLPSAYADVSLIFPILACAYVFRGVYIFDLNSFYYHKNTKALPLVTFFSGVVNIILNLIVIPVYGVYGAALSTVFCFFLNLVMFRSLAVRMQRHAYDVGSSLFLVGTVLLSSTMFLVLTGVSQISALIGHSLIPTLLLLAVIMFDIGGIRSFISKI